MRLISWNVNGIRACLKKGFLNYFQSEQADIFCLQETKLQQGQLELELQGYDQYWNYARKKGYSGTAVFSKIKPDKVIYGTDSSREDFENEGRVITLEFNGWTLVNVYTPNSQRDLARLPYRMEWEDHFHQYVHKLEEKQPVVLCGDLNVAHQEIDLKNPGTNRRNAGFTDEEREKFTRLLHSGYVDSFRQLFPDREHAYTWWSYMGKARERNAGWRIDYFVLSEKLADGLEVAEIHDRIMGSDHCPVAVNIRL